MWGMQDFSAHVSGALAALSCSRMAYLPNIRTFGFGGPCDDARHSQARFTGVHEVCGVHLSSQRLNVLQNGDLDLQRRGRSDIDDTDQRCRRGQLRDKRYLQVRSLSLIDDEPHQNVELLVKRERLPGKQDAFKLLRSAANEFYQIIMFIILILFSAADFSFILILSQNI